MFRARVYGYGRKTVPWSGSKSRLVRVLLVTDVSNTDGTVNENHMWLKETPEIKTLNLQHGDWIEFRAVVAPYRKGHKSLTGKSDKPLTMDYRLDKVRKVLKLEVRRDFT